MNDDIDTIEENRRKSEEKKQKGEYDVFISYNHKDWEQVKAILKLLKDNSISYFLDKEGLRPGLPWQPVLEHQIETGKAAAIFIGPADLGRWQRRELDAILDELADQGIPVIPVFLPATPLDMKIPRFLKNMTWVDFREKDPDPLERLIWGITGNHPARVYRSGILVASLGESPAVIPSMYRLLTEQKDFTIEQVIILHPDRERAEEIKRGCELLDKFFPYKQKLHYKALPFKDADSWLNACLFLNRLCDLLNNYQKQDETVYLSLAGGRKSMAALMGWVVPFFSCVQGLYHVIDPDDREFRSASDIQEQSISKSSALMNPDLKRLSLVEIPFERGQKISEPFLSRLLSEHPHDYERAEALIAGQVILQEDPIQQVFVTNRTVEQFRELCQRNSSHAQEVRNGLLAMSEPATIQAYKEPDPSAELAKGKMLHYFKELPVPIHPVFYTLPEDISTQPDVQVEQVVICSLEEPDANGYKTLKEVKKSPDFSPKSYSPVDILPPVAAPADSILIVPLGEIPMVATQLYTLLTKQEQHTIHEVVLIYPKRSTAITNSADIVKKALREEYGFDKTTCVGIPDLKDITTAEHCTIYQEHLEAEIKRVKERYPEDYKIDLALSGGRKGMTAMTIFAAQKNNIPYVYHTLITDEKISEQIDDETTVEALNLTRLSQARNARLFLHAYKTEGYNPYEHFTLFRVPVFTKDGWQ
ncbi:MAG: TIR domain-containing protein [Ktedonobacteraceae bacterium]|nr:TIR domain-containing protein [Ktedonobacteraceae bacterium]